MSHETDLSSAQAASVGAADRNALVYRRQGQVVWTPDLDAALSRLWTQPSGGQPSGGQPAGGAALSVREIAAKIGVSKNAAMGRIHRLKLPPRPSPVKSGRPLHAPQGAKSTALQGAKSTAPQGGQHRFVARTRQASAHRQAAMPAGAGGCMSCIAHEDLDFGRCQWPLSDGRPTWLFCGAPIARTSGARVGSRGMFCDAHAAKAFQRPAPQAPAALEKTEPAV